MHMQTHAELYANKNTQREDKNKLQLLYFVYCRCHPRGFRVLQCLSFGGYLCDCVFTSLLLLPILVFFWG